MYDNTINYVLIGVVVVLLILVIRRQMSLKISRTIDENVVIPFASSKPSSRKALSGRFGAEPNTTYYPTLVDSSGANKTLNTTNNFKYDSANNTLSSNLSGNADTASNLNNSSGNCSKTTGTSCAKIVYQKDSKTSNLVDDTNVSQGDVLTYDTTLGPVWKPISSGGGGGPPNRTIIQVPALTRKGINLTLRNFTDFITPLIASGISPTFGTSSGLSIDPISNKLITKVAGSYTVNMVIYYSTTVSVRSVYLQVIISGKTPSYTSALITTGFPWPNPPSVPAPIPYSIVNRTFTAVPANVTIEIGGVAINPNSGYTGTTVPMTIEPGSYIIIDKMA
jgi:hypothetical protein